MSSPLLSVLHNKASLSDIRMPARAKQALASILKDAKLDGRGVPYGDVVRALSADPDTTFIDSLWNDAANADVTTAFMNNKLCRDGAKGDAAALKAYESYAVQDWFYLVDFVKFQASRLVTVPLDDLATLSAETTAVGQSYGYAEDWYNTCITTLGIDPSRFSVERSIAELAYAQYLQNNTRLEDWFNLHVVVIGCLYGWSKLALELYNDPSTDKTTVFYETWIAANLDLTDPSAPKLGSWAVDLANFLSANSAAWSSDENKKQWQTLFRTGLRLEVSFFNSAYDV